jgi:hypothetical protein
LYTPPFFSRCLLINALMSKHDGQERGGRPPTPAGGPLKGRPINVSLEPKRSRRFEVRRGTAKKGDAG